MNWVLCFCVMCSGDVRWQQSQPSGLLSTVPVLSVPDLDGDKVPDVALMASDNTQVNISNLLLLHLFPWQWNHLIMLQQNKISPNSNVSLHICRLSCCSSRVRRVSRSVLRWFLTTQRQPIIFSIALQKVLTMYYYKKVCIWNQLRYSRHSWCPSAVRPAKPLLMEQCCSVELKREAIKKLKSY